MIALLAHLAIPLLARRAPDAAAPASARGAAEVVPVELEPPAPDPPNPPRPLDPPPEIASDRRPPPRARLPRALSDGAASSAPADTPQTAPQTPPPGGEADRGYAPAPDASPRAPVPGLGGPALWALPGLMPAPDATSSAPLAPVNPDAPGAVMREEMAENDRARGVEQLPGARAIASAIAEAARGPDAPETGQATFEVRVDRRGHAVELSLASAASGDVKAWRVVADNAARSIKGRSFALGAAFARGAKVYVDVVAEKALPSGKTRWFDPKRMFDRDRLPLPKPRLPDDTSTAGGKLNVPDAIFQLRVIDFDVTNFGAKAKRGVRASFRISPVY